MAGPRVNKVHCLWVYAGGGVHNNLCIAPPHPDSTSHIYSSTSYKRKNAHEKYITARVLTFLCHLKIFLDAIYIHVSEIDKIKAQLK